MPFARACAGIFQRAAVQNLRKVTAVDFGNKTRVGGKEDGNTSYGNHDPRHVVRQVIGRTDILVAAAILQIDKVDFDLWREAFDRGARPASGAVCQGRRMGVLERDKIEREKREQKAGEFSAAATDRKNHATSDRRKARKPPSPECPRLDFKAPICRRAAARCDICPISAVDRVAEGPMSQARSSKLVA